MTLWVCLAGCGDESIQPWKQAVLDGKVIPLPISAEEANRKREGLAPAAPVVVPLPVPPAPIGAVTVEPYVPPQPIEPIPKAP
jgi:hypothetical protein